MYSRVEPGIECIDNHRKSARQNSTKRTADEAELTRKKGTQNLKKHRTPPTAWIYEPQAPKDKREGEARGQANVCKTFSSKNREASERRDKRVSESKIEGEKTHDQK